MIRKATNEDIQLLVQISKECINKSFKNYYKEWLIKLYTEKYNPDFFLEYMYDHDFFIYFKKKLPVWMIWLRNNIIGSFYVKYESQRKRIWTKLFNFVVKEARKKWLKTLKLESTIMWRKFYEKRWFTYIKEIDKVIWDFKYKNAVYKIDI